MAGDVRAKREIAHLFVPAIAKKVIDLGGNVEKGQFSDDRLSKQVCFDRAVPSLLAPTMKLIGNSFILGSIEVMGEIMTLADKSGIGAEHVGIESDFPIYADSNF